jgi:hypothetical protein
MAKTKLSGRVATELLINPETGQPFPGKRLNIRGVVTEITSKPGNFGESVKFVGAFKACIVTETAGDGDVINLVRGEEIVTTSVFLPRTVQSVVRAAYDEAIVGTLPGSGVQIALDLDIYSAPDKRAPRGYRWETEIDLTKTQVHAFLE